MERAVQRGLARRQREVVSQVGVDEKAFRKGHRQSERSGLSVKLRAVSAIESFLLRCGEVPAKKRQRVHRQVPAGFGRAERVCIIEFYERRGHAG